MYGGPFRRRKVTEAHGATVRWAHGACLGTVSPSTKKHRDFPGEKGKLYPWSPCLFPNPLPRASTPISCNPAFLFLWKFWRSAKFEALPPQTYSDLSSHVSALSPQTWTSLTLRHSSAQWYSLLSKVLSLSTSRICCSLGPRQKMLL